MTTNDENILIAAIKNGDTKAYAQLVDRYKDLVYTLALRMLKHREEAEEVAQDTFIKVFKSLDNFKGDSKFSTWIYRVAYNTCLDTIKRNKKHLNNVAIDEFTFNKLDTIDNALDNIIKEEKSDLIKKCINKLPEDSSAILTLFYFEELSLDEISKIINIEANTVKVKLFRARKKLAVILEQYFQPKTAGQMENEDKRIEDLINKLMANDSLETAPTNFTEGVMSKIEALSETKIIAYKPLIHKYVWWLLGLGFVALITNIVLNKSSDSSSLTDRYNLPEVSFDLLNNLSVDFSNTLMYATVLLAVMIAIQIPLLKQYFNQKLSY